MTLPKLILASGSPRRSQLLKEVGLRFKVICPNAKEMIRPRENPSAVVRRLSQEKATSVVSTLKSLEEVVVLAADTIVVAQPRNQILGKPKNTGDAFKKLEMLSGCVHEVFTGYCLVRVQKGKQTQRVSRVVRSKVKMRALTKSGIQKYLQTGESRDKAGAYAAQGVGMGLIEEIRGSYTNVVGLPLAQVLRDLEDKFGISWLVKK